jgi:hypothetical protein
MTTNEWHEHLVKLAMEAFDRAATDTTTSATGPEQRARRNAFARCVRERMAQAAQAMMPMITEYEAERVCETHGIERRRCGCAA